MYYNHNMVRDSPDAKRALQKVSLGSDSFRAANASFTGRVVWLVGTVGTTASDRAPGTKDHWHCSGGRSWPWKTWKLGATTNTWSSWRPRCVTIFTVRWSKL